MSSEPTGALTFNDLILEAALTLGVAYYGAAGTEVAQIPTNVYDLAECKRYVNNAIRMFINDAPKHGWRWARPTASMILWPSVAVNAAVTATGVYVAPTTTITASTASFYPSMEGKTIAVTGVGNLTIASYTSATVVTVTANSPFVGATFSITADGNYTLPKTFGGEYTGAIRYAAGSNTGATVEWSSEDTIRSYREPSVVETGYPFRAAVRRMETPARRWELMVYPAPQAVVTVEFPYDLYFDRLTAVTEVHPAGYMFDEAVKVAVRATCEMEAMAGAGAFMSYYRQVALPGAWQADMRSAPRRLGYTGPQGSLSQDDYRRYVQRPIVANVVNTFTP